MKIITRAVLDWDGNVLEEESFEYSGPIAACKSSGSAPQPVDPYTQASAAYGLDTGTAAYNAAINRTNSSNPLGSNTWTVNGYDNVGSTGAPIYGIGGNQVGGKSPIPGWTPTKYGYNGPGASNYGGTGSAGGTGSSGAGTGAPLYSQNTSLTPWANKMLASPIDTSGIAGMPGGPSTTQDLNTTRNSLFNSEMGYLAPQQALQSEQTRSQLEAEGAMPGSDAYKTGEDQLNRDQTFQTNQAINSAIQGGGAEQSRLFGLGSQSLQDQLATRSAPISEYEALQGNPTAQVSAATPDISGAFGQQYQGALAAYNANTASNNATMGALGSLGAAGLFMLSDRRAKKDIERVGELDSGLPIYRYKYKGSETPQIGVMAQEAEEVFPEAVFSLGGLKHVNYGALS